MINISYIEKNTDLKIEYYEKITSTNERAKEIAEIRVRKNAEKNIVKNADRNVKKSVVESTEKDAEKSVMESTDRNAEKYIMKNTEKNVEDIRVVIAENQTKGKGTNGRVWQSQSGENILMTMIFYPNKRIKDFNNITYKIAEMIQSAINDLFDIKLTIKMPNDLLLNGKKICGILTESAVQNGYMNYIVIGIGFNVNQAEFPEELEEIATSLKKEFPNKNWDIEKIIVKMINNIKSLF